MVNSNIKYRWDFLGLSTDNKPTPEESNKVVNGSTYYETDTSKLYVFYKDQWYERKPLGGGGGGGSDINVVQTTGESTTDVMSQKAVTDVVALLDLGVHGATDLANTANNKATSALDGLDTKQPTLISGVNIKTVNGNSLLGSGDVEITGGVFVIDTANPCSYNELQNAINASNVILIKHQSNIYPFVEKWESDEGTRRYVNIASLQRQMVDKGAMYFFFEAVIADLDSPMVYSSNFAQPTGKPYTDSITGNLSNLNTTEKTNLVGAVNEVNGKLGMNLQIDVEKWYGTYTDENGDTYQVYSKVIYIPALSDTAGITTYPHGITGIKQILDAYGFTTDGFVLNAPRQNIADNIAIYQVQKSSTGGIAIEVGKDRSSKKAYVTLIYAKNN